MRSVAKYQLSFTSAENSRLVTRHLSSSSCTTESSLAQRMRTVLQGTVAPHVDQQTSGRVTSCKDETSSVVVYEGKLRQCFPQHPTSISVLLISIANNRTPSFMRLSCQNPIGLAKDAGKRSCRMHSTYPITPPSPALWHPDAASST
jgi:hypothetical protein